MPRIISIKNLAEYTKATAGQLCYNGDYLLLHVKPDVHHHDKGSAKIDGMAIFVCVDGEANINVNFKTVSLSPGTILVLGPNDIVDVIDNTVADTECFALFLPLDFLNMLSLDSNTINYKNLWIDESPVMQIDKKQSAMIVEYFHLLELSAVHNGETNLLTRNISRTLITALIYQLMSFGEIAKAAKADDPDAEPLPAGGGRRQYYVKDFMALVAAEFKQHRSVSYYADRLFISAKYLSLIIKEATGRTATEWIDSYVILEAKNLLRYSGRNIQQIAYDLNFHNQSAFGKYFKHITGMSPSDFRKS